MPTAKPDYHCCTDIPGLVEFGEGKGGLPRVLLQHSCGSAAEVQLLCHLWHIQAQHHLAASTVVNIVQVYLYGANVVSWRQASPNRDEVLYVRPDAVFDKSKPISGGIPHCFPVFGPAPAPLAQHGFARTSDWQVGSTSADQQPDERDPEVELVLTDNEQTRSMW